MPECRLIILQATPFCNINCSYCYLPNRTNRQTISSATITRSFERLIEAGWCGKTLRVAWHAGEPLVLPIKFYADAFSSISDVVGNGTNVTHHFQTNATLITQEWCDFFRSTNAKVGVSIDGPKWLHDKHRRYRSGRGSFDDAMRGLRLLKRNRLDFQVLTVLSRSSLDSANTLYDFFLQEGITSVAFNIEEVEGRHTDSSLKEDDSAEKYQRFLSEFWCRMADQGSPRYIREIHDMIDKIDLKPGSVVHNTLVEPFDIITIASNGDFSTFCPELMGYDSARHGSFVIGNVHLQGFAEARKSNKFQQIWDEVREGVELCKSCCEYYPVCGGGAPANKFFETGSFAVTETMHCKLNIQAVAKVSMQIGFDRAGRRIEPSAGGVG
ncbi:cyclophane-forming radical SAM/SPASM peptide maturase GrrM/OscB [Microvirga sp. 0TCS3.31]